MVRQSLQRSVRDRLGADSTEYGWLLAVVFAVVLARALVAGAVDVLVRLPHDSRLFGAVLYATAGSVVLVAASLAIARVRGLGIEIRPEDTIRLPLVAWGVLAVASYALLGGTDLPTFPASLVETFFGTVVPLWVLTAGYAALRGTSIRLGAPAGDAGPVVGPALVIAALAGVAPAVVRWGLAGPPMFGFGFGPPPFGTILFEAVAVPVLVGTGFGLLFNGAIQESLREPFGPVSAVAAVAALAAAVQLVAVPFPYGGTLVALVVFTAGVVVPVLAAFLTVRGVESVGRTTTGPTRRALAVALGVAGGVVFLVVGAFWALVIGWVFGLESVQAVGGLVLGAPAYLVAAGTASVGYERVRSAWVPALVFTVFRSGLAVGPYLAWIGS